MKWFKKKDEPKEPTRPVCRSAYGCVDCGWVQTALWGIDGDSVCPECGGELNKCVIRGVFHAGYYVPYMENPEFVRWRD
mgnify:CR=1 FL=1